MPECPLDAVQQRAFLYQQIRHFFAQRKVMEVETPVISSHANTDVQIEVFQTQGITADADVGYLRTSPEFFHKRLLAAGSGDIYEIAKVFRLGESSRRHNPEFTMLEWYRLDWTLFDLMDEVAVLMQSILGAFGWPKAEVKHITYVDLCQLHLGFNPITTQQDELNRCCQEHGYHGDAMSHSQCLDFLFAVVVEPKLNPIDLLFVYHFPASQAALAQINPEDPSTCLRFELMWQGLELANGYQELTDAEEQRQRFEQDNQVRSDMNKPTLPYDAHLLAAMAAGLPACSGVALGLDRLLMKLLKTDSLTGVLPFPAN